MIRIELQIELNYEIDGNGADFVFNLFPAVEKGQISLELDWEIVSTDISRSPDG